MPFIHLQSFPLNQEKSSLKIHDSCQLPSKYRIKSDLMKKMEEVEPEIFQVKTPVDDEPAADEKLSREEMLERTRELRRLRIRESQKSAKAHHQNKIKSKKYHRLMKREKMRQQIKEFEQLQKTDPEAALRKIEQLDRNRVKERATLRHRNTGTWAQNLQVRAKYDKDARKDLAEQIAVSRELTAKKPLDESDDDDDGAMDDANNNYDPSNPWLSKGGAAGGSAGGSSEVDDFVSGYRKYWQDRNENEKELKAYQADEAAPAEEVDANGSAVPVKAGADTKKAAKKRTVGDDAVASANVKAKKQSKTSASHDDARTIPAKKSKTNKGWLEEDMSPEPAAVAVLPVKVPKSKKQKASLADNLDDLFDDAEEEMRAKFEQRSKQLKTRLASTQPATKTNAKSKKRSIDDKIDLRLKKKIVRPTIDEELDIGAGAPAENPLHAQINEALTNIKAQNGHVNGGASENINPDDIAKVKAPQHLQTALPDMVYGAGENEFQDYEDMDYHFDEEKKLTIAEAFEDDDIVAEFEREKEDESKKNGPEEIDLSVPGWGSWSGSGIDPSKQKTKRKLILRFPEPEKRRNDNQGNVVLIENRDEQLKKHLVADLPFPFTSVDDYEQSIRQPLGKDFVPATAHRVLTKPAVVTKSGAIIEPMNQNMLVKAAKRPRTRTDKRIAETLDD